MKNLTLLERVETINEFLDAVFGEPTRLSDLLRRQGIPDDQIRVLTRNHLEPAVNRIGGAIAAYLLEVLPNNHAVVLSRRFCLEESRIFTLEEIAENLGLSRQRVHQLQQKGVLRLRGTKRRISIQEVVSNAALCSLDSPTNRQYKKRVIC
jgi:DNA-directed RNA polymerase sigma subunit (sigma70/sigma32)